MKVISAIKWLVALGMWGIATTAFGQDAITLYYYERPPFLTVKSDGSVSGLIGTRVAQIMSTSSVAFRWSLTPANRQLHLIRANAELSCGVGWYKTAQREKFALFSQAIYRDHGTVVIANAAIPTERFRTLAELLADRSVTIIVKEGLTYGPILAAVIGAAKAQIEPVTIEQPNMFKLIARDRGQAMFATREEADMLLNSDVDADNHVRVLAFPDLPPTGEPRYLMCSPNLGEAVLARINSAIDTLPPS